VVSHEKIEGLVHRGGENTPHPKVGLKGQRRGTPFRNGLEKASIIVVTAVLYFKKGDGTSNAIGRGGSKGG